MINPFQFHSIRYKCQFCPMEFVKEHLWTAHEIRCRGCHFDCELCNRRFESIATLDKHQKYHSYWQKRSTSSSSLHKIPCGFCSRKLGSEQSLMVHMAQYHPWRVKANGTLLSRTPSPSQSQVTISDSETDSIIILNPKSAPSPPEFWGWGVKKVGTVFHCPSPSHRIFAEFERKKRSGQAKNNSKRSNLSTMTSTFPVKNLHVTVGFPDISDYF